MDNVCRGVRNYRQGDDLQYVHDGRMQNGGKDATSAFIDCNQYKQNGIRN